MRKSELVALMIVCPMIVRAADKLEPLNVKPGEWEMTITSRATGQMPISDEMLARLTPEMRARMEQYWKEQASKAPQTRTYKSCVTEEDVKKSFFGSGAKSSCTRTVLASSSNRLDVREECNSKDGKQTMTYHLQTSTPESVTGDTDTEISASGRTMKGKGTFTAKWMGAACKDDN